ncbi:hypothetical protein [Leptospira noguchii]|nr:hypothetical protein [Leptospira noguchii]UOG31328.1 hypothetical protein MAL06_04645 [Leptospira noguchii]
MALLKLTNVNLRERDRYGELKHNAFLNSASTPRTQQNAFYESVLGRSK